MAAESPPSILAADASAVPVDSASADAAGASGAPGAPDLRAPSDQGSTGDSLGSAGGALGEALGSVLRLLLKRGRVEVERVAQDGRQRLELRQLHRDRDAMYMKIGREVRNLVEGREIVHPGLVKGVERIRELDQRIAEAEDRAKAQRNAGSSAASVPDSEDQRS